MIKHQFSKRFKKDTDADFKYKEFAKFVGKYFETFIECYPHLVEKKDIPHLPGEEMWVFKFAAFGETPPCEHEGMDTTVKFPICGKCGYRPYLNKKAPDHSGA